MNRGLWPLLALLALPAVAEDITDTMPPSDAVQFGCKVELITDAANQYPPQRLRYWANTEAKSIAQPDWVLTVGYYKTRKAALKQCDKWMGKVSEALCKAKGGKLRKGRCFAAE